MTTSTRTSRDLMGLPIDQRGHKHIHDRHSDTPPVALQDGMVNDEGTVWFTPRVYGPVFNCASCDTYPVWETVEDSDGNPVSLAAETACELPDGITTVIELAVPSGKMIVNDDLRPIFDWDMDRDAGKPGYNSVAGQDLVIKAMAERGCAYGPVLNSSPSLLRTGEDKYIISNYDPELAPGEDGNPVGVELAGVCTDLWAYSIADYDNWFAKLTAWLEQTDLESDRHRNMKELAAWVEAGADPAKLPWTMTVVDVTPGVYRFTHHTGEAGFDHDDWPALFADVELIR